MTRLLLLLLLLACGVPQPASGAEPPLEEGNAASLQELLQRVRQGQARISADSAAREARFRAAKDEQARLLEEAHAALAAERQRADALDAQFAANATELAAREAELRTRLGSLGEAFAHLAGEAAAARERLARSQTAPQLGNERLALFERLAAMGTNRDVLPTLADMQAFWYEIQRETVETGRVVRYAAPVLGIDGERHATTVVRVGAFDTVSVDGDYLRFDPAAGLLAMPAREAPGSAGASAANLAAATAGSARFALDPTGAADGRLLAMLAAQPSFAERIRAGGWAGLALTLIVLAGIALALRAWFRHDTYVRHEHIPALLAFLAILCLLLGLAGSTLGAMRQLELEAVRHGTQAPPDLRLLAAALVPLAQGAVAAIVLFALRGLLLVHTPWHLPPGEPSP